MANPLISLAKRALQGAAKRVTGRTAVGRAFKAAAAELAPIVEPAKKVKNTVDKVTSTANKVANTVEHGADIAPKAIDVAPKPSDVIKPVKELKKLPTKLGDASSKYKSVDAYKEEAREIIKNYVYDGNSTRKEGKQKALQHIDDVITEIKDDITSSDDENERKALRKKLDELEGLYNELSSMETIHKKSVDEFTDWVYDVL